MTTDITKGTLVRYNTPGDDEDVTFRVVEDRDTRVLMQPLMLEHWTIVPTMAAFKRDLMVVGE